MHMNVLISNSQKAEMNKMSEESVEMEYISLQGKISNTPSGRDVLAKHQLSADWSDWPVEKNI